MASRVAAVARDWSFRMTTRVGYGRLLEWGLSSTTVHHVTQVLRKPFGDAMRQGITDPEPLRPRGGSSKRDRSPQPERNRIRAYPHGKAKESLKARTQPGSGFRVERPEGIEPPTRWSEASCSVR